MLSSFLRTLVNRAFVSFALTCITFCALAEDLDYRNLHNNMSKATDPDAENAAPHLPKVI